MRESLHCNTGWQDHLSGLLQRQVMRSLPVPTCREMPPHTTGGGGCRLCYQVPGSKLFYGLGYRSGSPTPAPALPPDPSPVQAAFTPSRQTCQSPQLVDFTGPPPVLRQESFPRLHYRRAAALDSPCLRPADAGGQGRSHRVFLHTAGTF